MVAAARRVDSLTAHVSAPQSLRRRRLPRELRADQDRAGGRPRPPRPRAAGRRGRLAGARALRQRGRRHRGGRLRDQTRSSASSSRARHPTTMAKSTGLGLLELPTVFELLKPDVVVTVADRFETIATAIAAAYMNIPVAHTQGGEVSGSIDESVRHAVTKLAHLHFPATELSRQRVIAMGEDPQSVFNVGCPSIDLVAQVDERHARAGADGPQRRRRRRGDRSQPPVRADDAAPGDDRVRPGLRPDQRDARGGREAGHAGARLLAQRRRRLRAGGQGHAAVPRARAAPTASTSSATCPPEIFVRLMAHCACMVGNSSAALREGAFLGTPAVTVGTRQQDREHGRNVVEVGYDTRRDRRRDPRPDRATAATSATSCSATARPAAGSPSSSRGRSRRSRSS